MDTWMREKNLKVGILLYCWKLRFTLKIITKMLREVVNRVKLGDHYTRAFHLPTRGPWVGTRGKNRNSRVGSVCCFVLLNR